MSKRIDKSRLDDLIDEATVDCYGDEEEHTALLTIIEERVICLPEVVQTSRLALNGSMTEGLGKARYMKPGTDLFRELELAEPSVPGRAKRMHD